MRPGDLVRYKFWDETMLVLGIRGSWLRVLFSGTGEVMEFNFMIRDGWEVIHETR